MRIKQSILKKYKPFYSYNRKIAGYNVTVNLYTEPCHCVNIIKEKDNVITRTCYKVTEDKILSYILADKIYKDANNNAALLERVKHAKDNNSDIVVDKFLNNVIKGIEMRG